MQPAPEVVDRQSALDFLLGRINYERTTSVPYRSNEFKLDRMRRLLAGLDDPHLALKAIHIAGTKGKGSTAVMVSSILASAGHRVGLYTSPHLESLEERVVVNGQQCGEDAFVRLAADMQRAVEEMDRNPLAGMRRPGATFFEITTAMAMLHFARQRVDAAVFEVGLGGRLDSTNVCLPVACVITSISFDHMKQLGNTLAAIAREKAGIIKPGVPVVSGVTEPEPRAVIQATAAEHSAPLFERSVHFQGQHLPQHDARGHAETERLNYGEMIGPNAYRLDELQVGMLGEHQADNAALAIAALRRLVEQGWTIPETAMRRGLASARCAARVEIVSQQPLVILDVAHNMASVEALVRVLDERFANRRRVLLFASSRDKDTAGMLRTLLPRFDAVVITRYVNNPRAVEPAEVLQVAAEIVNERIADQTHSPPELETAAEPVAAWQRACQLAGSEDLICITGSFFLAAELRPILLNQPATRSQPA